MVDLPVPETELNDILGSMWNLGLVTHGMTLTIHGYQGEPIEYESDFGKVLLIGE